MIAPHEGEQFWTYVYIVGIWDNQGNPGATPSGGTWAMSEVTRALLTGGRLPGDLVWVDRLRNGHISIIYLEQFINDSGGGRFYHLTAYLTESGASRGFSEESRTSAVVGAWIPETQYHDMEPQVLQIVKSVEFMKPQKACWSD